MDILLSKEKINKLQNELQKLETHLREQHETEHSLILTSFRDAAVFDVSIKALEARVKKLKSILKNIKELPIKTRSSNIIIGSYFKIRYEDNAVIRYRLVDPVEADPLNGLLSMKSPLGELVAGKQKGDSVLFKGKKLEIHSVE